MAKKDYDPTTPRLPEEDAATRQVTPVGASRFVHPPRTGTGLQSARQCDAQGAGMDSILGKYELKSQLGKGSSGTVYRALDTFSGDEVAVKIIDPAVFRDPENGAVLRRQFLKEASLAGKLTHPHIASILDAVVTDDAGYIVMEYVPGENLTRHASADHLLSPDDAVQVVFKCCGALDFAFRQGVIHRDIKPANIMIVEGNDVKITDFGAAFLHSRDATQSVNIGSPAYMSPEQINAKPLTHA